MVIDTITKALVGALEQLEEFFGLVDDRRREESAARLQKLLEGEEVTVTDPQTGEEVQVALDGERDDILDPIRDIIGELPEESQELILEELQPEDITGDGNVRKAIQGAEGGAVAQAVTVIAGTLGVEAASAGQLESQQFIVSQLLTFLALENVLGLEIQTTVEEGVSPELAREINEEYRSKNVDLQDAIEQQLRNKDSDTGYLEDLGIYGIREQGIPILEEVAIRQIEPEELIETPAEAGVIPSEEVLQEELDRAGLSEQAKELFLETVNELPKTTRIYQERIRAEELVNQLDELVAAEEITPEQAAERVSFLREETQAELQQRFTDLQDLPAGPPTRSQVENGFTNGLIGIDRYLDLLETVDVDPEKHPYVPQEAILSELDGDLRTAVGLGLLSEAEYTELANTAGLGETTVRRLLEGDDLDEIAEENLQDQVGEGTLPVDVVGGIGPVRRRALEAGGIGSVGDLSQADPGRVAEVANVSESTASDFIQGAQALTQTDQ